MQWVENAKTKNSASEKGELNIHPNDAARVSHHTLVGWASMNRLTSRKLGLEPGYYKKCCLLDGMLCYKMLFVTCMPCYEMLSVTFMSQSMSCLLSYVYVTLCYVRTSVFYVTFVSRHVTK